MTQLDFQVFLGKTANKNKLIINRNTSKCFIFKIGPKILRPTPVCVNSCINLLILALGVGCILGIGNNKAAAFIPGELRDEGQLVSNVDGVKKKL